MRDDGDGTGRPRWIETQLVRRGVRDPAVLDAMEAVPRERFVPPEMASMAYDDRALPIGEDQTISQPYIVAAMTEALSPEAGDRVLEVGTGSGYQTAILAEIVAEVCTVERHGTLSEEARGTLEALGYGNVRYRVGDGTLGWPAMSPFEGIIVTAAAPSPPPPLVEQLGNGGRLVIPTGTRFSQELHRYVKRDGELEGERLMGCRFVPLVGEEGWAPE